jgi:hypothetical protein
MYYVVRAKIMNDANENADDPAGFVDREDASDSLPRIMELPAGDLAADLPDRFVDGTAEMLGDDSSEWDWDASVEDPPEGFLP